MAIRRSATFCFLAVFFASGTVFISGTAKPSSIWAATTWTYCTFTILFDNLFGSSHGNQFFSNVGFLAVFFTSSTVFISGTAEPSSIRATSSRTNCTFAILFHNLLGGSHGNQFLSNVGFLAVFFTGGTIFISRTAKPSSIWATSSRTNCTFTILFDHLFGSSHRHQDFGKISFLTVFFTGSTVFISRTAEPSSIWATSSRADSTLTVLFDNFFRSSHCHQFLSNVGFLAVFFTGGTVFISRTAKPSSIWATSSRTNCTFAVLFSFLR